MARRKIVLKKAWGMFPKGHVFENPSLVTIRTLCFDQNFGRLVGDKEILEIWKRQQIATKQLLAESDAGGGPHKDVWKEQLDKERAKETVELDGIVEDFEGKTETLPAAEHKVTKKKPAPKQGRKPTQRRRKR